MAGNRSSEQEAPVTRWMFDPETQRLVDEIEQGDRLIPTRNDIDKARDTLRLQLDGIPLVEIQDATAEGGQPQIMPQRNLGLSELRSRMNQARVGLLFKVNPNLAQKGRDLKDVQGYE